MVYDRRCDDVQIDAWGEMTCSPSVSVTLWRRPVWDVNGYYFRLGLPTDATKAQIRAAFMALDGHDDERLTYIVKVLLDPELRESYDSSPLGSLWFDRYVYEGERLRLQQSDDFVPSTGDDDVTYGGPSLLETLDEQMHSPTKVDSESDLWDDLPPGGSLWGHYRWRCGSSTPATISRWRFLIASALSEAGHSLHFGVGVAGRHLPLDWGVMPLSGRPVIFIREHVAPSEALAAQAAQVVGEVYATNKIQKSNNPQHQESNTP